MSGANSTQQGFSPNEEELEKLQSDQRTKNLISLGLLPIASMAGALNIVIIALSMRFYRKTGGAPYAIICSLTLADSLQTTVASPYLIYYKALSLYAENYRHCLAVSSMIWFSRPCSAMSLAFLSIDKLLYIHRPYQYPIWMAPRRIYLGILICWMMALCNVVFINTFEWIRITPDEIKSDLFHKNGNINFCDGYREEVNMNWFLVENAMFAVFPILLAVIVTIYLFRRARKDRTPTTSATTTLLNTIWIFLTLTPLRVFYILKWTPGVHSDWVEFWLLCIESIYAIVNPILTFTLNEHYLKKVRHTFTFGAQVNVRLFFFYF